MIRERLKTFLQEQLRTHEIHHSGRNLYQHLVGTHDLLEKWGFGPDLCRAGLFHSIYGTRRFRHQSWPLSDRDTIKKLIWPEAEQLVYLFCVTNRPRALFEGNMSIFDHHLQAIVPLSRKTRRELLTIEAANLLEQNGSPHWLERLLRHNVGDAAKDDIRQHLKAALHA
jgi:Domain of unknown function (DUF6817)